mmetsp:Transcript_5092/g.14169  ORF Transcript_5092/g.14169 Transcript_5092/m.14169 type:complete len:313 (+) Transcript_5092:603-1541(+)
MFTVLPFRWANSKAPPQSATCIGTRCSARRSSPFRRNLPLSCTTHTSTASPAAKPGSACPWPWATRRSFGTMPGGTTKATIACSSTSFSPPQPWQSWFAGSSFPSPRHVAHNTRCSTIMWPNCTNCAHSPAPRQEWHSRKIPPGMTPEPRHAWQALMRTTGASTVPPVYANSKGMAHCVTTGCACICSPCPAEASEVVLARAWRAFSSSTPCRPCMSYTLRKWGSESTPYAWATSSKAPRAPPLSGWCFMHCRLYAFLTSSGVASGVICSTSYSVLGFTSSWSASTPTPSVAGAARSPGACDCGGELRLGLV